MWLVHVLPPLIVKINFVHTIRENISYRSLNAIVTKLKNFPLWVNTTFELKHFKTTNNSSKQQNTIKLNTLKSISKYNNRVLVVSTFSCAYLSTHLLLLMPLLSPVSDMILQQTDIISLQGINREGFKLKRAVSCEVRPTLHTHTNLNLQKIILFFLLLNRTAHL